MSRNGAIIAVVAVLVMASVGTGFALSYLTTTTSRDNTIPYDGITLEVQDNNHKPLGTSIPVVGPTTELTDDNLTHISGGCNFSYYLDLHCPPVDENTEGTVNLQCWFNLNNQETWAIIDSVKISINDGAVTHTADFVKKGSDDTDPYTMSVPTAPLPLTTGVYSFTVSIQYRSIDLDLNGASEDFLNLSGSTISFSASADGSVPGTYTPWTVPATP